MKRIAIALAFLLIAAGALAQPIPQGKWWRKPELVQVLNLSDEQQDFVRALPRKAAKAVERLQGMAAGASVDGWFAALGQAADRAGLLACDDVGAAARMLAKLGGEELPEGGALALGQIPGVAELVRFYLSDAYHELRTALGDPGGRL